MVIRHRTPLRLRGHRFRADGPQGRRFLYEKGHRTVAFLRNNESDYDRRSGYVILFRESLLAHAKERGMTIIESEHYEEDSFDAKRFVRTIFARPDRPSAIINQANAACSAKCWWSCTTME